MALDALVLKEKKCETVKKGVQTWNKVLWSDENSTTANLPESITPTEKQSSGSVMLVRVKGKMDGANYREILRRTWSLPEI